MTDIKYIAAGFSNDADRLIRDFVKENSMEFSVFAEIWKKHNFSLIYAFRPNGRELREFTLEIFQLSINFLKSSSLLYQVGGTFLLYSLYRNQILSPPLKIRIVSSQLKTISVLLELSLTEMNRSLHYVASYLVKNSFYFVACLDLKGPNSIRNEPHRDDEYDLKIQEADIKHELTEISKDNVLQEIDRLFLQYKRNALSINTPIVRTTSNHNSLKEFAVRIDKLLNENKVSDQDTCRNANSSAVGSRRALIKAAAFSNPACHYLTPTTCVSEGIESSSEVQSKLPIRKKRCVRRGRRKVGRPKKWVSEDSMSEEDLQPNTDESFKEKVSSGRRQRKSRGSQFTKIRSYYANDFAEDHSNVTSTFNSLSLKEFLFSSGSGSTEEP